MECRLSTNEEDVMKLCKFLREDISVRQADLIHAHLEHRIDDNVQVQSSIRNDAYNDKLLITQEYLQQCQNEGKGDNLMNIQQY